MTVATDPRKTGISGGANLLATSSVAASITGTVNETTLATVTVPGGAMGLNGGVEIRYLWSFTNSANTKTCRVKFGGTTVGSYAVTANAYAFDVRRVRNRGAANSQICTSGSTTISLSAGTTTAPVTTTKDTTADVVIDLTAQLTNTGETITLESYEVWLLPG